MNRQNVIEQKVLTNFFCCNICHTDWHMLIEHNQTIHRGEPPPLPVSVRHMPTVPKLPTTLPPLNEDAVESEDTVSLWMVDCDLETMDDIGGELLSPPLEEVEEKPRTLAKGDIVTYSCPSELCSKVYTSRSGLKYHITQGKCPVERYITQDIPASASRDGAAVPPLSISRETPKEPGPSTSRP